ncbi:TPA: restriction endonuclease subunit S, partial [Escherichia coli]|nr:restriction endonuclease subunit S [Escherichia coli]
MTFKNVVKLGDFVTIKHGYAFPGKFITSQETKKILVTPGNFNIGGGFKSSKFKYYSGETYPEQYRFNGGELIVTMTDLSKETDTLGYAALVPNDNNIYLHNQRVGLVQILNNDLDKMYLYWKMRTREYQEFIANSASGTSVMHTSPKKICEYEFLLPTKLEQKAIASVLSSLDDKIDLLHRQNKTLESMAETLFRQWFIEDAQIHWTEKKLSSFGSIICGKTPSKKNSLYFGNDVPFLKIPDMHGKVFVFKSTDNLSFAGEHSQSKKTIPPGSICVSCIATVGLVCITDVSMQTNQQINSIIPNKEYYKYFLYLLMKSMGDELNNLASGGTATLNLNTGDFSNITFLSPSENELKIFHQSIS